jgi:phosphatidylserine/phosphatidylglycerophosphate/cardiolipin synthase-like enzyme
MHHKFVVIDGVEVWAGSMNLTLNGAYHNDNNLIRLRSLELAQNYLTEFDEMFVSGQYGGLSAANTPYPLVTFSDAVIENYFAPEDPAEDRIVSLIEGAQQEVLFMAFVITSDPITDALLEASLRGVRIQGVIEEQQVDNIGSDYYAFLDSGLDVRLDGNPAKMHHKVIIIDRSIVITGSYNFSRSASVRNDENLLVIFSPAVAAEFLLEFERVLAEAQ